VVPRRSHVLKGNGEFTAEAQATLSLWERAAFRLAGPHPALRATFSQREKGLVLYGFLPTASFAPYIRGKHAGNTSGNTPKGIHEAQPC
jgi:hypothetical protein